MEYQNLLLDVSDAVAHIRLNRPDAMNSITCELAHDLMHAALRCDEDPAIRAVLLSGEGRAFCVGGDLKAFAGKEEDLPYYLKETTTYLHATVSRFTRMDAPVVAAVHGAAAGAGMSLACACDYVVAAESARFTMAYTQAGLIPDGSSTYFLPRIVGLRRALELVLTNRMLSAAEAVEWGIANKVAADDRLLDEARQVATKLAAGATKALGAAKRLLHRGLTETLETQMELETRAIADASRTQDGREGIAAFLGKRPPVFSGN